MLLLNFGQRGVERVTGSWRRQPNATTIVPGRVSRKPPRHGHFRFRCATRGTRNRDMIRRLWGKIGSPAGDCNPINSTSRDIRGLGSPFNRS
jgi:hypothetical protein